MLENERLIKVDLPKKDMEDLMELCGMHGIWISELVEGFLSDLVGGAHSHGSDERDYAKQWFDRCEFGMFPQETLLRHLIIQGDPEEYISLIDGIEREKNLKKCAEENPEEFDEEEIENMDENIAYMENELKDMRDGWEPDYEPDMEWEVIKVRSWVEDKRKLG